ncbi:DB module [Cooperia oncophora]
MIVEILVYSVLVRTSIQCLTSGVCGGGGYCSSTPAVPCHASSCQPGYSCGQYGCSRNRARSALTKKVDGIFISDESEESTLQPERNDVEEGFAEERNIYGMSRGMGKAKLKVHTPSPPRKDIDNATLQKLANPNYIFRECCEQRGLPDACLDKCHFNTYTRDALQSMYFKTDGCPIEATADMHFCAAQGRDHTEVHCVY